MAISFFKHEEVHPVLFLEELGYLNDKKEEDKKKEVFDKGRNKDNLKNSEEEQK